MIKKLFNKLFGTNENAISFGQGFYLTELPIVTLFQNGKGFNFLLDTGSNNSIIDSNILKELEYKNIDSQSSLCGVEGNNKVVPICNMTLNYKDKSYTYDYLINDMKEVFGTIKQETGVSIHGIIGSKFFNEFKYVLDFDELIAYSKK